jgi:hypothetical protein
MFLAFPLYPSQNDVLPTDYVAQKEGSTIITLYYFDSGFDGYYFHENKVSNETLYISTEVVRLSYATNLWGYTTALVGVVIGSQAKVTDETSRGFGDLRLGMTTWLINDSENKHYFAITPMISLPVGTYRPDETLNIGENRYKFTLNAGYINRLYQSNLGELFSESTLEFAFYGDNSNYDSGKKMEQDYSYAFTSYVRYKPFFRFGLFVGYQFNRGGDKILDGILQNNKTNNERFMLGTEVIVNRTQIMFRYTQDTKIDNGFIMDRQFMARFLWAF